MSGIFAITYNSRYKMERTNQGTICVFVDAYPVYVVAIHWWIQGRGPVPPPPSPLFLDQIEARQKGTLAKQIKTSIKSRRSWRHMASENEHSRNHELYTTETLRHRTANMD